MNTATKTPYRTEQFLAAWDAAPKLDYNPEWANGTGYLDHSVSGEHKVVLEPGQMAASRAPAPNDRKILFVATRLGVIAIFQRYSGGAGHTFTFNADDRLERARLVHGTGSLSDDDMDFYIHGLVNPTNHLHYLVERACDVFKDALIAEAGAELI